MKFDVSKVPQEICDWKADVAVILGSGLNYFADQRVTISHRLPYSQIPGMSAPSVPGHEGQCILGDIHGQKLVLMQGRSHYYEGRTMADLRAPIQMLRAAGIRSLIITNAVGGINRDYSAGDFVLISDHINMMGVNPLIGWESEGERFPDMSEVYNREWRKRVITHCETDSALQNVHEGVYVGTSGPCFETPAEIRAYSQMGADVVGMSAVIEAIVARRLGMKLLSISCVTNAAAGISKQPLSLEEVVETANSVRPQFIALLESAIKAARQV